MNTNQPHLVLSLAYDDDKYDYYQVLYGDENTNKRGWVACDPGGHVPTAQAASLLHEWRARKLEVVSIEAATRRISHWPQQWKPETLQIEAVNCPEIPLLDELFELSLTVNEFPQIPISAYRFSLYMHHLPGILTFQRVSFAKCHLYYKTCEEFPIWSFRVNGKWSRWLKNKALIDLDLLYHLLIQGLSTSGPWQQWLTQGLYDPRLFFEIVSFI